MDRFWPARISATAGILLALLLLFPSAGGAQVYPDPNTGTGGTGGTGNNNSGLTKADFQIFLSIKNEKGDYVRFNTTLSDTFFNRARCLCNSPVRVEVALTPAGKMKALSIPRAEIRLLGGDQTCVCTGAACANVRCNQIDMPRDLNALINYGLNFDTTARAVFDAGKSGAPGSTDSCNRDEMQNLWVWMDRSDDATADTVLTDVNFAVRLDGLPPVPPAGLQVTPGNEALEVRWQSLPYLDDLQGYIIFCSRNGDIPVFPGAHTPEYISPASLCSGPVTGLLTSTQQALADDATPGRRGLAPPEIRALDPRFACSGVITSATTSHRLYQLQNGIPYVVAVASVDKRGNASPIEEVVIEAPIPTRDFYRSYRDAGGTAEGGFCAVARPDATPGHGLLLLLFAPVVALLARRRRR